MRITQTEQTALYQATKKTFGEAAVIWMFGSRADDTKHGGDIDLYIETDMQNNIVQAKIDFRNQIYPTFGEQKIDLVVRRRHFPLEAFHELARESGVEIIEQSR